MSVPATSDSDAVKVQKGQLSISEDSQTRKISAIEIGVNHIINGDYTSFMHLEMFEQPESASNTMNGRVNFTDKTVNFPEFKKCIPQMRRSGRLIFIGSGSSYHSAIATRQLFEELTDHAISVDQPSDFLDRKPSLSRGDVCFFISESGESLSTLNALRYCKQRGSIIVCLTNNFSSPICRESHCGIDIKAGPEIGVASTKTFISEFITLVMIALILSEDRVSLQARRNEIIEGLQNLNEQIREVLNMDDTIRALAKDLYGEQNILFVGRGYNYASCLEGALKVKELSYLHSEALLAGELKHGSLALIDQDMPIIMIITRDRVYQKCITALQQITARKGRPIVFCEEGDVDVESLASKMIFVPHTVDCLQGILTTIPMQLLAYHIAVLRGCNVDCPRYLIKSVIEE